MTKRRQPRLAITRRRFLQLAAAGAASAAWPAGVLGASEASVVRRAIPASGQAVPVIGLGTARTFDVGPNDTAAMQPLRGVMRAFHEGGGLVVDSSPMYGRAESVVGTLAADLGIVDELFMATKVWTQGRDDGIEQMKQSRQRMGGGRLELIQVHNLVDLRTHLKTLKRWRDEGRVRYIGVTHYTTGYHDDLARIVEREPIDFVQFNYNIATRNAENRLLPACADNGVATLINEPFETGALFGRVSGGEVPQWAREELGIKSWAQLFLKYIVGHPAVTCAIPATSDAKHAADNIAAARAPLPDQRQRERLAQAL
jgi:diketogulonate reductase-like aldo/keto reductase